VAERHVVCPADELAPGQRRLVVPFRGRAGIGVFNIAGSFHALRNLCPHKSGPLCTGNVFGRIVADLPPSDRPLDVDDYRVDQEGEIIRCPWHLWEFEIATGRCLVDPAMRVKTYPTVVEDGMLVVYADRADLPPSPPLPASAMA
jgi:3-phenylpropionate/trans-cinnamate dioxygenase ferredoxin subunit